MFGVTLHCVGLFSYIIYLLSVLSKNFTKRLKPILKNDKLISSYKLDFRSTKKKL